MGWIIHCRIGCFACVGAIARKSIFFFVCFWNELTSFRWPSMLAFLFVTFSIILCLVVRANGWAFFAVSLILLKNVGRQCNLYSISSNFSSIYNLFGSEDSLKGVHCVHSSIYYLRKCILEPWILYFLVFVRSIDQFFVILLMLFWIAVSKPRNNAVKFLFISSACVFWSDHWDNFSWDRLVSIQ
jgi:hypothetical protein